MQSDPKYFLDKVAATDNHGFLKVEGNWDNHRPMFRSFESHEVWALKCGSEFVKNWDDDMLYWPCSVAFVDHAPGEHRHIAIKRLAEFADIIVIHDTEEGGAGNYQFHKIWHLFTYRLNYNKTGGGAGATAVSNKIDLYKFRGLSLGKYTFDND